MKCKVCGAESGKYTLCRACNIKKEQGLVIKCNKCNMWHYADKDCAVKKVDEKSDFLYNAKSTLISKSEKGFYSAICNAVPQGYYVFPQVNLASFIYRTDDARFHNELFRNVDFLITDSEYHPKIVVEINDQSHLNADRKERDEKVKKICEEAGVPVLKLWTSYGVNEEYIKGRINDQLISLPINRVSHFRNSVVQENRDVQNEKVQTSDNINNTSSAIQNPNNKTKAKKGCYIATAVYGSYDCPEVWVLRRFRDDFLSKRVLGRGFIKIYYFISPIIVNYFGEKLWLKSIVKNRLNILVRLLEAKGYENTYYSD